MSANVTGTLDDMDISTCGNYTSVGLDYVCTDLKGALDMWTSCDRFTYGNDSCVCEPCNDGKGLMVDCSEVNEEAKTIGCAELTLMEVMTSGDSMDMTVYFGKDTTADAASTNGNYDTEEESAASTNALYTSAVLAAFIGFVAIV